MQVHMVYRSVAVLFALVPKSSHSLLKEPLIFVKSILIKTVLGPQHGPLKNCTMNWYMLVVTVTNYTNVNLVESINKL